jgi:effector-binding domain-containing protein
MTITCSIQEESAQPSLVVRVRTSVQDLPRMFGECFGRVAGYMASLGETPAGPPYAAYHNADMQDLDVEIGFPASKPLTGAAGIEASRIPGGRMASCMYTGPYNGVGKAYGELHAWMEKQGHKGRGPSYEIYLNDPATTPPEALQTLILMLLK